MTVLTITTIDRCPACRSPLSERKRNNGGGFRCEFDCGAVSDTTATASGVVTVFHGCPVSIDGALGW